MKMYDSEDLSPLQRIMEHYGYIVVWSDDPDIKVGSNRDTIRYMNGPLKQGIKVIAEATYEEYAETCKFGGIPTRMTKDQYPGLRYWRVITD